MTHPPPHPAALGASVIEHDRPCVSCGYNVKGLSYGQRCPECGQPIRRFRRSDDYPLTEAPIAYLRVLNAAAWGAALSGLGAPVGFFYAYTELSTSAALGAGLAGAVWVASVYVLTQPRPSMTDRPVAPAPQKDKLRLAALVTQAAWPVCGLLMMFWLITPATLQLPMGVLVWLMALVGVLGFVPTSIRFADLADWARDTSLSSRLRGCAWFITFAAAYQLLTLALSPLSSLLAGLLAIGQFFVNFAFFGSLVVFLVGVLQLAGNTRWAIKNNQAAQAKAERDAKRREAELRRRHEELNRMDAALGAKGPEPAARARPSPFASDGKETIPFAEDPEPNRPRPGTRTQRVERPEGGADTYDIEPDGR